MKRSLTPNSEAKKTNWVVKLSSSAAHLLRRDRISVASHSARAAARSKIKSAGAKLTLLLTSTMSARVAARKPLVFCLRFRLRICLVLLREVRTSEFDFQGCGLDFVFG